ncbi:MAG: ATP-binding protein, partial [Clostridiales bacterium]|nr:ATP-binding protein [Clostridiales bacterium]
MSERIFPARLDQLDSVLTFIDEELERNHCSPREKYQLDIAAEEIFVNIAHYAYHPEQPGEATVRFFIGGETLQVTIQFLDNGQPFNPL